MSVRAYIARRLVSQGLGDGTSGGNTLPCQLPADKVFVPWLDQSKCARDNMTRLRRVIFEKKPRNRPSTLSWILHGSPPSSFPVSLLGYVFTFPASERVGASQSRPPARWRWGRAFPNLNILFSWLGGALPHQVCVRVAAAKESISLALEVVVLVIRHLQAKQEERGQISSSRKSTVTSKNFLASVRSLARSVPSLNLSELSGCPITYYKCSEAFLYLFGLPFYSIVLF